MFNTLNFKALMDLNKCLPSTIILGDIVNNSLGGKLIIDFLFNIKGTVYGDTLVYTRQPTHYEVERDILKSLVFFLVDL